MVAVLGRLAVVEPVVDRQPLAVSSPLTATHAKRPRLLHIPIMTLPFAFAVKARLNHERFIDGRDGQNSVKCRRNQRGGCLSPKTGDLRSLDNLGEFKPPTS